MILVAHDLLEVIRDVDVVVEFGIVDDPCFDVEPGGDIASLALVANERTLAIGELEVGKDIVSKRKGHGVRAIVAMVGDEGDADFVAQPTKIAGQRKVAMHDDGSLYPLVAKLRNGRSDGGVQSLTGLMQDNEVAGMRPTNDGRVVTHDGDGKIVGGINHRVGEALRQDGSGFGAQRLGETTLGLAEPLHRNEDDDGSERVRGRHG